MTDSEKTLDYMSDTVSEASSKTEPTPNHIMSMMMTLLQKTQEDAVRREEDDRRRDAEKKQEEKPVTLPTYPPNSRTSLRYWIRVTLLMRTKLVSYLRLLPVSWQL